MTMAWNVRLCRAGSRGGCSLQDPVTGLHTIKLPYEFRKQIKPPEAETGMELELEIFWRSGGWLSFFQLFSAESNITDRLRWGSTMKNHGSLEGIREQASLKLEEDATDFHLLQTDERRKNAEVGSLERTPSRRSSLSSSIKNVLEMQFSSWDFLFRVIMKAEQFSCSIN